MKVSSRSIFGPEKKLFTRHEITHGMGRPRTTGCAKPHYGRLCAECGRVRAARSRAVARARRRREPATVLAETRPSTPVAPEHYDPQRDELDRAAAAHRAQAARARAYVAQYRARNAIVLPDACEGCGGRVRPEPWAPVRALVAWHPDPARPREIAWLCSPCRRRVRATREPLTLTWTWPGTPLAPRRPIAIAPAWREAGTAAARGLGPALSAAGRAEAFLAAFFSTAGAAARDALYTAGARAAQGAAAWVPSGDDAFDALLRAWVAGERRRRADEAEVRLVEPAPAWERRTRRDRRAAPSLPERVPQPREPFDAAAHAARSEAALRRLEEAEAGRGSQ
jgi:hypothetical protein